MAFSDLFNPPEPCSGCGAMLAWQVARDRDEYVWADADGCTQVPTGLPEPLAVAYEIGQRITAATTGPKRKRGPMPSEEEVAWYSVVINCPTAYGTPHIHRHDARPLHGPGHSPADVAWHCGEPMRLRPSGWHCRARCGHVEPVLAAV